MEDERHQQAEKQQKIIHDNGSSHSLRFGHDLGSRRATAIEISRSCSAPPAEFIVNKALVAERPLSLTASLSRAPGRASEALATDYDEPISEDDPRRDPNYANFFHAHSRLDPRLPPPLYAPGQSWQQIWTLSSGAGRPHNFHQPDRLHSRLVPTATASILATQEEADEEAEGVALQVAHAHDEELLVGGSSLLDDFEQLQLEIASSSASGSTSSSSPPTSSTVGAADALRSHAHHHRASQQRKKLVDMIQEDFPRTPSPVYSTQLKLSNILPSQTQAQASTTTTTAAATVGLFTEHPEAATLVGGLSHGQAPRHYSMDPQNPAWTHSAAGPHQQLHPHHTHHQPFSVYQAPPQQHIPGYPPSYYQQPPAGPPPIFFGNGTMAAGRLSTPHFADPQSFAPHNHHLVDSSMPEGLSLNPAGHAVNSNLAGSNRPRSQSTRLPFSKKSFAPMAPSLAPHSSSISGPPGTPTTSNEALLDDIKTNRGRSIELADLAGRIVELCCDQHGSRFIQQRLESASSLEREVLFTELYPSALELMTDVFGNYVIQKYFEYGTPAQKKALCEVMVGHVLDLSLQMYGCRVVQKALEHSPSQSQTAICAELEDHVLRCVKDQNGNHVIQKCIECVPPESAPFLTRAFCGQVYSLATHPYGCRVIQRFFEHGSPEQTRPLIDELHRFTDELVQDQYGNYVIQHLLERGAPEDRSQVIDRVRGHVLEMTRHKFASNVVEKCVVFASHTERQDLIDEVLTISSLDNTFPLLLMMKDQFANYVVQKMLDLVNGQQRALLLERIKPHLTALRKLTYGKHIIAKVDKMLASYA